MRFKIYDDFLHLIVKFLWRNRLWDLYIKNWG